MFYSISSIGPVCRRLRDRGTKIVLATGFFDLLHQEHLNFLQKARERGDVLVVAVESDARARELKGEGRPVQTQVVRCQNISPFADYVIALGDDFNNPAAYASLMIAVSPAIYAVSSHTEHLANKQKIADQYGCQLVVVHEHNPKVSTTQIINLNKQV